MFRLLLAWALSALALLVAAAIVPGAVTFTIDTDGILSVRAKDVKTGRAANARIQVLGAPEQTAAGATPPPIPVDAPAVPRA